MTTLQIRGKGTITLPASLRKKYKLEEGEVLTVIDLGEGTILLKPMVSGQQTIQSHCQATRGRECHSG